MRSRAVWVGCVWMIVACIACGDDDGVGGSGGGTAGTAGNAGTGGSGGVGGTSGSGGVGGTSGSGGVGGTSGSGGSAGTAGVAGVGTIMEPGDPGPSDVQFEIRADREQRPISPLIYGTNGGSEIETTHQTVIRSGGNRMTAYNWENNASNAGSDWYFQNDAFLTSSNTPGQVISDLLDQAIDNHAAAIVTIPNVDYVAADKNGDGDRRMDADYLATRFRQNRPRKGSAFAMSPDVNDAFVYQDEFVAWLKASYPNGNVLFSMDNEPDLWSSTHNEVHPSPVTYAELWQRNHDFAAACKAVWPEADVLGFVSYGYAGYMNLQNASDANGRNFIEWYLDQAQATEISEGTRLIDYLDLHWYPEARGGGARVTDGGNNADTVSARLQAPRSLWDSSYREDSWIANDVVNGPIDLLHWLQVKIDAHYPGTKLAFTEWNYGGGDHISGALAVADVLGTFGRYGVSLATYWGLKSDESFAYAGIRVFRNFDGNGGAFGDTSIAATTSDVERASVYASIDSDDPSRTVIVAINKHTAALTAGITVAQTVDYDSAQVYRLAGTQAQVMAASALTPSADNAFVYEMPAQSVSILVLSP